MTEVITFLLGNGRNKIREIAEVFRPNAEAEAIRRLSMSESALGQFSAEFSRPRKGVFDRFIDGLNRLPRPALAMGTLALFVSAMYNPIWFAERMQGIALVPEPLWWLMGAVVSFYFGARHQVKGQEFKQSVAATVQGTRQVAENIRELRLLEIEEAVVAEATGAGFGQDFDRENTALMDWKTSRE